MYDYNYSTQSYQWCHYNFSLYCIDSGIKSHDILNRISLWRARRKINFFGDPPHAIRLFFALNFAIKCIAMTTSMIIDVLLFLILYIEAALLCCI